MDCPSCSAKDVITTNTRGENGIRKRSRVCKVCGKRFKTIEITEENYFEMIKTYKSNVLDQLFETLKKFQEKNL